MITKVCHIAVADLWGGAEVHLVTLLLSLSKMQDLEMSVVLFTEGRVAQELRAAGLDVVVIAEDKHNLFVILWKLVKHFREHQFMIVHAHKPKDSFLGGVACRLAGVPYLVRTLHGSWEPFSGFEHFKIKIYEYIDRLSNRYLVNAIIAVTQKIHSLLTQGYLREKVVCIHNGIDVEALMLSRKGLNIRKELDISKRTVLLGIVGRLTAVKGHIHLLKAMRILVGKGKDVHLVIAGDGPLRMQLEDLVTEFQIQKNVVFVGHQSNVSDLIEAMDIFVLPSLNEGIPMVLLEAMALSRPVVASRTGGVPEIIEDGKSGLLVEPGNPMAIAEAVDSLIRQMGQADQLGRNGRARVSRNFTASIMAEKTAHLYRRLVSSSIKAEPPISITD
jgi:glycosyltransferase involved in cell wall biosynthesis